MIWTDIILSSEAGRATLSGRAFQMIIVPAYAGMKKLRMIDYFVEERLLRVSYLMIGYGADFSR
jgi:hypothetical protein